ncbi:MAG: dTDP-4-dehydrorhamnose 3,5-epimerase [Bacteroidetes bacterium]|nr:dTDP-4-dehydrorhamnose 3,5-epimerase [Bacteroidota bacterium]
MNIVPTEIPEVLIVEPKVFADERGFFYETYNENTFKSHNINAKFVQDNLSKSSKNILRGLHFQKPPFTQGKLVKVIQGSVLDVCVDLRLASPTYGKHIKVLLSENNNRMLWVPEGFAHGFLTLEDETIFYYKCTNFYHAESDSSILWNDPALNIDWGITNPILSDKDRNAKKLSEFYGLF